MDPKTIECPVCEEHGVTILREEFVHGKPRFELGNLGEVGDRPLVAVVLYCKCDKCGKEFTLQVKP
jgi:hypothetical protein